MTKQLTTLALSVALGSMILTGNAQACHKPKCPKPVVACAPAPKKPCCFKMPKFHMPKLCCKKPAPCTTVAYAPAPSAQTPTPQH